ncbi:MAG: leader peptide processing enzyme [Treponema sp.]|jgi:hypothetical protein|nr:leader peptide processing enzyme [Treponema sp.]
MSKKTNTLLFILGATFFNILVTVICFTALLVLYARFIASLLPEAGRSWGFPVIFIAAIALSFVIYRAVLKLLMKKINVEQHFDPIFGGRRRPRKDQ